MGNRIQFGLVLLFVGIGGLGMIAFLLIKNGLQMNNDDLFGAVFMSSISLVSAGAGWKLLRK